MKNRGIKLRVSDGNGGRTHIVWLPGPVTISAWIITTVVILGALIVNASAINFRWTQIPINTEWIAQHENENVIVKNKLDSMCELTKAIYLQIDPQNAPKAIKQIEDQERSLKESMRLLQKNRRENNGNERIGK
jgi:hypothetical protein